MATKTITKIVVLILALGALTGCGALAQDEGLRLANIGWDENVAVSNLTKVLLEEELDYQSVEVRTQEDLERVSSREPDSARSSPPPRVGSR